MNDSCSNLFSQAALENLEYNHSDHRPLLVDLEYYRGTGLAPNIKPKRFEARWIRENSFNEIVQEAWTRVGDDPNVRNISEKLNKMHSEFHDWDQRVLKKPKNGSGKLRWTSREL